jgi:hypothetical protein
VWGLYGASVVPFLKRIEPYLILKGEQARLVIELEERRMLEPRGPRPRSIEFLQLAASVVDKIHGLNWVGSIPRNISANPNNPKCGGRPRGMRNGQGKRATAGGIFSQDVPVVKGEP